jgi:hypothetical protein
MNRQHSPWPLFTDDLEAARAWLKPQLEIAPVSIRTGHLALSLGMAETIERLIRQPDALSPGASAQWGFRLARLHGAENPYSQLVPAALQQVADQTIRRCLNTGEALVIELNGGIGDHLEAFSLVIPWAGAVGLALELRCEARRQQQLAALLADLPGLRWSGQAGLPVMAVRHWLCGQSEPVIYKQWLHLAGARPMGLLCCWRAEGSGDPLSAHARSIPFVQVVRFYRRTQQQVPGLQIVDISRWQAWEAAQLQQLGVQLHDPSQGDLKDLAHMVLKHHVLSIDTALAHLCAALGHPATLLLPRFCDERWHELRDPVNSYGQNLRIKQSTQFGSWQALIDSLEAADWLGTSSTATDRPSRQ